jgi:L-ascorbate metabolism protein UlaG (beta-lactamase superfamily)
MRKVSFFYEKYVILDAQRRGSREFWSKLKLTRSSIATQSRMTVVLKIFLGFFLFCNCSCAFNSDKPYYNGPVSDHFDGKRFISTDQNTSFRKDLRFLFTIKDSWSGAPQEVEYLKPSRFAPVDQARITFIGHSTFLIQFPELNILTDPIWSERAGPINLPFFSPARHNPPAIEFDDLPKINYVLISHSSYYHMDLPTIKKLQAKFNPKFITGLGKCYYLNEVKKLGLSCIELDWGQDVKLQNETVFYFLPAKNWSKRSWFDVNKTLWGSFAIIAPTLKIYFAGDSGFSQHLRNIGLEYGPFDVALLPIGSYEPRARMKNNHMNPEEAVKAHILLNAKKSIGMHFNSFQTTSEGYYDGQIALEEAKISFGLKKAEFVAPKFGESFEF